MTSWTTPVQDLIQQLGPKTNGQDVHLWPLLEVLTVLPEEMGSRNLRLGANRRAEVLKLFTASTDDVLRLLVYMTYQLFSHFYLFIDVLNCKSTGLLLECT